MTDDELPPDIARALQIERSRPEPSGTDAAAERALARVLATVALSGAGAAGRGDPGSDGGRGDSGGNGGPGGPGGSGGSGAGPAGAASAAAATLTSKGAMILAAIAALGGAVAGASLHAVLAPTPEVRERTVERIVEVRVEVPVEIHPDAGAVTDAGAPPLHEPSALIEAPRSPDAPSSEEVRSGPDRDLARETRIVERARTALSHGDARAALEALREHASQFPRGALVEQREALAVTALVRAGEREAAEERATRFRARYPRSAFTPAIDAALRMPQ